MKTEITKLQKFVVTIYPAPYVYEVEARSKEEAQEIVIDREFAESGWSEIHKIVVTKTV